MYCFKIAEIIQIFLSLFKKHHFIYLFVCLFVLMLFSPSQQFFSHVRTGLPLGSAVAQW